jgi:crotonobetainyl-CoA:carnitine CoA-transferase CaiB-like acyl-CoA transferase
MAQCAASELSEVLAGHGGRQVRTGRPHDVFDGRQLGAIGAMAQLRLPPDASGAGRELDTRMPLLPFTLSGRRLPLRTSPPALGAHTGTLLSELGYSAADIEALRSEGIIGCASPAGTADTDEVAERKESNACGT